MPTRRRFIQSNLLAGASLLLPGSASESPDSWPVLPVPTTGPLDLAPAHWLWYPSTRTPVNTFVLFRRAINLPAAPRAAQGWILGDSRYRLFVNGERVQWGPAPADPRYAEADPLDLAPYLRPGPNVLAVEVLYYGHGDGTWPAGKPGFIFHLTLDLPGAAPLLLVSDRQWHTQVATAWPPGQYKRWYLRALQEVFDAQAYPAGWAEPGYIPDAAWVPAQELDGRPDQPALATEYPDYLGDTSAGATHTALLPRTIPLLHEVLLPVRGLVAAYALRWQQPPELYFTMCSPGAYTVEPAPVARPSGTGWTVTRPAGQAAVLTFDLTEQVVGWPYFEIEAPAGTTVELLTHEAHDPARPGLINTHFHAWSRFTCRAGKNRFEAFDFESLRWLQLHLHPGEGVVRIWGVGVRRRTYPWRQLAHLRLPEPALQRLVQASLNTLDNCAQETLVDGMGRERQPYSGDVGHQLHALYTLRGEYDLPARFLRTYSQGLTQDGYFLDTWPAYDRLARLAQRQLGLTPWGPLLDHGVGFTFDAWYHYCYSGRLADLAEVWPRLMRFFTYLRDRRATDGLLPVTDLGVPVVWMDNYFAHQADKRCAFNLYVAAMMREPLPALCEAHGRPDLAQRVRNTGDQLLRATQQIYWDGHTWVNNLPQVAAGAAPRHDYRSLSMALLHDLCPGGHTAESLRLLVEMPPSVAPAFLPNEGWRLRALAQHGRADVVVHELRTRWATLNTVLLNNTLGEDWDMQPDSRSQWSHAGVAPLYVAVMGLAGITMCAPGGTRVQVRPQLADLEGLALTCHTPQGPIGFEASGDSLRLDLPAGVTAALCLPRHLPPQPGGAAQGAHWVYSLTGNWRGRFR